MASLPRRRAARKGDPIEKERVPVRHLRQPEQRMATSAENRRYRRLTARARWIIVCAMVMAITVTSVVTAVANAVNVTVIDGGTVYTFNMMGLTAENVLARAETEGMAPLSDIDSYEFDMASGTMTVHRSVRVSVRDGDETGTFVADQGAALSDVLAANSWPVGVRDHVEPSLGTVLMSDTNVSVTRMNNVTLDADGVRVRREMLGGTVGDLLRENGITLGAQDSVTPPAETLLEDGMRVRVGRYAELSVTADGRTVPFAGAASTWADVLGSLGIAFAEEDRLIAGGETVDPDGYVVDGAALRLVRITTEEFVSIEPLAYAVEYQYTDELLNGEMAEPTEGMDGTKRVLYRVTYADGVKESEVPLEEDVITPAENSIVRVGNRLPSNTDILRKGGVVLDSAGMEIQYVASLYGSCTAYYDADRKGMTSIGEPVKVGNVAVDPDLIPYGSLLYITSPDGSYVYGYCQAMDTGIAMLEGVTLADLYYDTEEECAVFGRRDMMIYVIREGWGD